MIWVDREIKKIKGLPRASRGEWVDDMKTPSGRIHVGALRGVIIHDLVYKVLIENKVKTNFSYVFNDHDPMDGLPSYLDTNAWNKYMGMPLYKIPSPEKGFKSFAEYYAEEFRNVFESINCHPQIIWSSQLYNSGKMNKVIKEILDAASKIRAIYLKVAKAKRASDWYPFNVVCEKCQKIGTTYVYQWDGEFVYYRCLPNYVEWAKGCGHQGKISPFNGNGKLPWKLDWPAHWNVIGVTIEGAGKDHMSAGGSYDFAKAICEEVLNYPSPYAIAYEWFIIGGRKMSSSKGIGASAKEIADILPPELLRYLIVRTPIDRTLDFNPEGATIPNLFDDYDRSMNAYFTKLENKLPSGKQGEVMEDFARIIQLSTVRPLPKKRILLPRFRTIANLINSKTDLLKFFEKQKGSSFNDEEKTILEERIVYAQVYLKNYSDEVVQAKKISPTEFQLNENQKAFLKDLANELKSKNPQSAEAIQNIIFTVLKKGNYKPKEAFSGFYQVLTGKPFGPKAADIILQMGANNVIEKINKIN